MAEFPFGRKFGLLARLYLAALSEKLKHLGIKKHFSILMLVDKMGDQCSQKYLAELLHVDKTLMVGVLDELSALGFIQRVQNPSDRREYWIQLTTKGRKYMPEIRSAVCEMNQAMLAGFQEEEAAAFHKQLEVIYQNIQTISQA